MTAPRIYGLPMIPGPDIYKGPLLSRLSLPNRLSILAPVMVVFLKHCAVYASLNACQKVVSCNQESR